jgi:hypothetical protein
MCATSVVYDVELKASKGGIPVFIGNKLGIGVEKVM